MPVFLQTCAQDGVFFFVDPRPLRRNTSFSGGNDFACCPSSFRLRITFYPASAILPPRSRSMPDFFWAPPTFIKFCSRFLCNVPFSLIRSPCGFLSPSPFPPPPPSALHIVFFWYLFHSSSFFSFFLFSGPPPQSFDSPPSRLLRPPPPLF